MFPEGFKGIGKPFRERYQLQRFGRGGFASTAHGGGRADRPVRDCRGRGDLPDDRELEEHGQAARLPYFPVTPLFPWLGPIGAVPLPSNWIIEFCPPVPTDAVSFNGTGPADAVSYLADMVRDTIQDKLDELLVERGPAFS